jgi:hypothetical protein
MHDKAASADSSSRTQQITAPRERAEHPGEAETATFAQTDSVATPARLEVRCPSCHAPVQLAVKTPLASVTCASCGSQFSLINENDACGGRAH